MTSSPATSLPDTNSPGSIAPLIASVLLAIYVFVLPIGQTIALRNLAFFSLVALTLWLALRGRIRPVVPLLRPWVLYAAVAGISLSYAVEPMYSLGEIKREIVFLFLAMVMGATWIRTSQHFTRLMWAIIASNIILISGSFYYALPFFALDTSIAVGSLNIGMGKLSTYIVLVLPFIAARWWMLPDHHRISKIILKILIAGNIAALYFTGNRAGLVAIFMETIVLAVLLAKYRPTWLRRRKPWVALALAVLLFGILEVRQINNRDPLAANVSASISTDSRWTVWNFAVQNIASRPLTGGGFGLHAFKLLNPGYPKNNPANNATLWHAHNTLLNVGIQTGLPGMTAFIILILAALRKVSAPLREMSEWNTTRIYSLAAVVMFAGLVVKLQTDDFFSRDIALFFWLIVGALSSLQRTFSTK